MDLDKFIVQDTISVIDVLKRLDSLTIAQTVFVVDCNNKLIGTITDGDIRRGLINGNSISDPVVNFMSTNFRALNGSVDPIKIKEYRNFGVNLLPVLNKDGSIRKVYDLERISTILPVDVVIMAGGKGERLRPLTNSTPKPMLPLGNKPIIEHNIDRLRSFGIENIYISINYLGEQIKDYFGDGKDKGLNIQYLEEKEFLGTIGSASMVDQYESPYVLVMNSDLFTDVDFEDLWVNLCERAADLAVASIPYTVNIPFAILTRENGCIKGLKEKPSNTHYANAGIYLMKRKVMELIPKNEFFNATDLIEKLIQTGKTVIDNPITGYWIDIGRHEEYNKAKEIIRHLK
ncbi:nucleotidyltransferase family protein [Carboxylicivirga sediminis]|uniref:Nucleotidyltransferase family protein n=1 Tax=Carboxylicivirga sediminis TaxID=2006564 RepID=A0A941F5U4_9BACT|nr:nucleotidyltransferase family protein [Carboxylicivirga sediminis]MBR8537386.1 nucleotidyltransferase family protein [Carboxylicivirga sediminis]